MPRLVLQGSKDAFGSAAEMRAAIGAAPGYAWSSCPAPTTATGLAKAATFTAADLRAVVVGEVLEFVVVVGNRTRCSALNQTCRMFAESS